MTGRAVSRTIGTAAPVACQFTVQTDKLSDHSSTCALPLPLPQVSMKCQFSQFEQQCTVKLSAISGSGVVCGCLSALRYDVLATSAAIPNPADLSGPSAFAAIATRVNMSCSANRQAVRSQFDMRFAVAIAAGINEVSVQSVRTAMHSQAVSHQWQRSCLRLSIRSALRCACRVSRYPKPCRSIRTVSFRCDRPPGSICHTVLLPDLPDW